MIQVVFGTSNLSKIVDVKKFASRFGLDVLSLADINITSKDIPETGNSLEENAIIKYKVLRSIVPEEYLLVTEDYGLEIEALNGEPGVHSRRWNPEGREMTDQELIDKTLRLLKNKENRNASNVCVIAYGGNELKMQTLRGELAGMILESPDDKATEPGLPYRSLFYVPQAKMMLYKMHGTTLDDRSNIMTHREQVWSKLAESI